jgi:hypothetical protein
MQLTFKSDELHALCSSDVLLMRRFGLNGPIVGRRVRVLMNAPRLKDVTVRPPDRRRLEPAYGPRALSVCGKEAGRIYFQALGPPDISLEDVESIEIFAIGEGAAE